MAKHTAHDTLAFVAILLAIASLVVGLEVEVTKVLHFPKDQCVGGLSVEDPCLGSEYFELGRDLSFPFGFDPKCVRLAGDWDFIGSAQGDVVVPADRNVQLTVVLRPMDADASRLSELSRYFLQDRVTVDPEDLSGLSSLAPDDLYCLRVGALVRRRDADQLVLEPISRLTGLRILSLSQTGVTDAQMHRLKPLQSLRALEFCQESSIKNAGLAVLKDLPALEYLDLDTATTDVGFKHLGQLQNLRWLRLRTGRTWGPGLAELAKLPRLERLCLWGTTGISDRQVSYLEGLTRLKSLTLWGTSYPLTDATLASIGKLTSLEELYFICIATKFTDAGLAHLKNLRRLRRVEGLGSPGIDAEGLRHLAALPNLECIDDVELSAEAIAVLPSFRNLKALHFVGMMPPKGKPVPLVDISGLANLTGLEDLFLASDRWAPEDLVVLGFLKALRRLRVMDDVTDENLATIGTLKKLEHLNLSGDGVTKRGLNQLQGLTKLETLGVKVFSMTGPQIDETPLQLSSLKNLKTFSASGVLLVDADLASLAGMRHLEWLTLQNCTFSEAGLHHLQDLTALKILTIGDLDCPTGVGLACLAELESLRDLRLQGPITDAALGHLGDLPAVWSLWIVTDELIRPETVARLRKRLPAIQHIHVVEPPRFGKPPVRVRKTQEGTPPRSSGRRRQGVPRNQRRR